MEAGEGVGWRTHDHGGELHVSDGQRVDSGGYRAAVPGGQIPDYQDDGSCEARRHHQQPEQLDRPPGGAGDEDEAVDGGVLQELLDCSRHAAGDWDWQELKLHNLATLTSLFLLLSPGCNYLVTFLVIIDHQ